MKRLAVAAAILLVGTISVAHTEPATLTGPPPSPPIWSQATIIAGVFSLFAGAAFGAVINFGAGIANQRIAAGQRVAALRASLWAELSQLVNVMRDEDSFADAAPWTWLPVRDYFDAYRKNQEVSYRLTQDEVGVVTGAMHVVEERMGYLYRKSQDVSADKGPPFGRNIKLQYEGGEHDRRSFKDDFVAMAEAAEAARDVIGKKAGPRTDVPRTKKVATKSETTS
jgi:hypothetical protein